MAIEADLHPTARFPKPNNIGYAHRMAMSGLAERFLGPYFSAESYKQLMQVYLGTRNESLQLMQQYVGARNNIMQRMQQYVDASNNAM